MNLKEKAIADYFGELISKGWNRQEAIGATSQSFYISIAETEKATHHRG